jgi:ankyrin repeat protein
VKEIIDLGKVNIERKFGQNYRSSLNWACYSGAKECCAMLLNKKANKESADSDKNTPLLTAMARSHLEIASHLIKQNVNINATNN